MGFRVKFRASHISPHPFHPLTLFESQTQLQSFDWNIFSTVDSLAARIYGKILIIVWTLFAAIVMANLLIAIVSQVCDNRALLCARERDRPTLLSSP